MDNPVTYEQAEAIYDAAMEAAQDVPDGNPEASKAEAVAQTKYRIGELVKAELARSRETIEIVAAQRNRALEAVEKLRETIIDTARFLKAHQDKTDGELYTIGKLEEVLAATEPATVELPKCDHCGAIACGTDCDGSSHYTPDAAKGGN